QGRGRGQPRPGEPGRRQRASAPDRDPLPRAAAHPGARVARAPSTAVEEDTMKRQNIQPDKLSKRVVGGHTLYSHVVVVEARKTIFVAGQLARDGQGNVVGKGDM